jgi:hypothetical protein
MKKPLEGGNLQEVGQKNTEWYLSVEGMKLKVTSPRMEGEMNANDYRRM